MIFIFFFWIFPFLLSNIFQWELSFFVWFLCIFFRFLFILCDFYVYFRGFFSFCCFISSIFFLVDRLFCSLYSLYSFCRDSCVLRWDQPYRSFIFLEMKPSWDQWSCPRQQSPRAWICPHTTGSILRLRCFNSLFFCFLSSNSLHVLPITYYTTRSLSRHWPYNIAWLRISWLTPMKHSTIIR